MMKNQLTPIQLSDIRKNLSDYFNRIQGGEILHMTYRDKKNESHLFQLENFTISPEESLWQGETRPSEFDQKLKKRLDEFPLSKQLANTSDKAGIIYVGDLIARNWKDFIILPGMRESAIKEIEAEILDGLELCFDKDPTSETGSVLEQEASNAYWRARPDNTVTTYFAMSSDIVKGQFFMPNLMKSGRTIIKDTENKNIAVFTPLDAEW